jgi:hypothetical protein
MSAVSSYDLAGRCFVTLRIRLSECSTGGLELMEPGVARRPGREVPERVPVELIGVEPTTSSLQSWRSTN